MSILRRHSRKKSRLIENLKELPSKVLEENDQNRISGSLEETVNFMTEMLGDSDDFVIKHFRVFGRFQAVMFYCSNVNVRRPHK